MKKKNIIIPDRIFHKLWDNASKFDSFNEFYNKTTHTGTSIYINLYKYGFSVDQLYDTLILVYKYSNISFKNILSEHNLSKAKLSHQFCIPIRTIENWCNDTPCPSYIKLFILDALSVKILPKYIYTESSYNKRQPYYRDKDEPQSNNPKAKNATLSIDKIENLEKKDEISLDKIDSYLKDLKNKSYNFSMKEFEENNVNYSKSSISDTDYLGKIIRRKN